MQERFVKKVILTTHKLGLTFYKSFYTTSIYYNIMTIYATLFFFNQMLNIREDLFMKNLYVPTKNTFKK